MIPQKENLRSIDTYINTFREITNNFVSGLDRRDVASLNTSIIKENLSDNGLAFDESIEKIKNDIIPNLSASRGGRYWGFVTGGATPIATFADWLVSTFDQNVSKGGDSIATEIERQALDWLKELFYLPNTFKGVVTTGATAANFLAALTSRQFVGRQQGLDIAKNGMSGLDVTIFSTTPHASMIKSLGMAGLGQNQIQSVLPLKNSEEMDVFDLEHQLSKSKSKGKIVIASAGTVTGTDFDDFKKIRYLCDKYNAWLHVDAAFGIFERLVKGVKGDTEGLDTANSITLDCHKWLNVPYDCGVFLTRHQSYLYESCDVPAPYLTSSSSEPDFMSLGIENSRRFRAFPVWMTLLTYGRKGVVSWVEKNIKIAKSFGEWIDKSNSYELIKPCKLNVVLFRPNIDDSELDVQDKLTVKVLDEINRSGKLFLSPGVWGGKKIIRAAISNWQTDDNDLEIAIDQLINISKQLNFNKRG